MPPSPNRWEQIDLLGSLEAVPAEPAAATAPESRSRVATIPDPNPAPTPKPASEPSSEPSSEAAKESAREPASAPAHEPDALPACPERLLILDTETTGLSPRHGRCIEVGAVLFHVPSRAVLNQLSFLLPCEQNPAHHVNGIDPAVTTLPQPREAALACFQALVASADALLAHNAAFDRQWFGHGPLPALELPWICSMDDIRWPAERGLRPNPSVRDLALSYGVPVWAAHRALTDCTYLVQVFERCPELEPLLRAALEPRQLYRANVSYDQRHLAREAGFRWNEPVQGAWCRRLTRREVEALPFPVQALDPLPASA